MTTFTKGIPSSGECSVPWTSLILGAGSLAAVITVFASWKADPMIAGVGFVSGCVVGRGLAAVAALFLDDHESNRDEAALAMALFLPVVLWAFFWLAWMEEMKLLPTIGMYSVLGVVLAVFAGPITLAATAAAALPKQWGLWRFVVGVQTVSLTGFLLLATSVAPGMLTYDPSGDMLYHSTWRFLDLSSLRVGKPPVWRRLSGRFTIEGLPEGWSAEALGRIEHPESIPVESMSAYQQLLSTGTIVSLVASKRLELDANGDAKVSLVRWFASAFPGLTLEHVVVRYTPPVREWK